MSNPLGTLMTVLGGDNNPLLKAVEQAQTKLNNFVGQVDKAGQHWDSMAQKMTGMDLLGHTLGFAGLGASIGSSIHHFIEAERVHVMLEESLARVGVTADEDTEKFYEMAGAIAAVTTKTKGAMMTAMSLGLNMGISANQLEDATKAAVGLSALYRARGLSMETAMMLIARAMNGSTMALARYGIFIDHTLSPQQKMAELLAIGAKGFQMEEHYANTLPGVFDRMNNSVKAFWKTVGGVLSDGLMLYSVFKAVREGVLYLKEALENLTAGQKHLISMFLATTTTLGAVFVGFGLLHMVWGWVVKTGVQLISALISLTSFLVSPATLAVAAFGVFLVMLVDIMGTGETLGEKFTNIWNGIVDVTKGATDGMGSFVAEFFFGAIDWCQRLYDAFKFVFEFIIKFGQYTLGNIFEYWRVSWTNALTVLEWLSDNWTAIWKGMKDVAWALIEDLFLNIQAVLTKISENGLNPSKWNNNPLNMPGFAKSTEALANTTWKDAPQLQSYDFKNPLDAFGEALEHWEKSQSSKWSDSVKSGFQKLLDWWHSLQKGADKPNFGGGSGGGVATPVTKYAAAVLQGTTEAYKAEIAAMSQTKTDGQTLVEQAKKQTDYQRRMVSLLDKQERREVHDEMEEGEEEIGG